jgi:hypothetical protein
MIPARLTGKPFWDIYVHQDPTLWKAYIDAARYFDIDAGFELYDFGDLFGDEAPRERRIVPMSFRRINVSRLLVFTRAQAICFTFPKDIGTMCPGWHPRCGIAQRIPFTTPQTKLHSSNISCSGPRNNNGAGSGRPLRSALGMLRDADHDRHLRYPVAELPKLTNGVECNIFNRQLIKQARWRYGGHDVW